ncbi:MAG TPA: phosphoadenylyl-sulfate reductase [Blastocatellia bacterium]|nr:phosphoadenylyl-sulfate reductase [Blastocatellia bacterium]
MAQPESEIVELRINPLNRIKNIALELENASPQQVIRRAFDEFADKIAIATGFGAEGVALIDMAVKINPRANIFFLDTRFLFPETYELRRRIEERYGVEIRAFQTSLTPEMQEQMYGPSLWSRDPDLCCRIRKLEPLKDALKGLSAWMTGIRRDQTAQRADAQVIEWDYRWQLVKVNPLARWTKRNVWEYIARNRVPYNPLHDEGYPSIGCTHCTRAVREGEDDRAGRWPGHAKKECGLHVATAQPRFEITDLRFEIQRQEIQQTGD